MAGSILGFSPAEFLAGMMLILIFAVDARLAAGGRARRDGRACSACDSASSPSTACASDPARAQPRAVQDRAGDPPRRAGTREAMLQDYVKFARAKGLSERRIVLVHVLKNIMIPIVTVLGLEFGLDDRLRRRHRDDVRLAGHGQAADRLDQPARPAGGRRLPHADRVMFIVLINLVVDILYAALDPRIRLKDARHERHRPRPPSALEEPRRRRRAARVAARHLRRRCSRTGWPSRLRARPADRLAALAAPWIAPQNPYDLAQLDIIDGHARAGLGEPAGMTYWLGTDEQGRDMLSAILYGLRISLDVGAARRRSSRWRSARRSGLLRRLFRRLGRTLIMRIVDLQLGFPVDPRSR